MEYKKTGFVILTSLLFIIQIPMIFASISFPPNVIYRPINNGGIIFSKNIFASTAYFSNEMLYFQQIEIDRGTWGLIGFSVSQNAEMTINRISYKKIIYTVNADTDTKSTTKIFIGNRDPPYKVKGAFSYEYNRYTHTLTVIAYHQSPETIMIEWEGPVQKWVNMTFPTIELFGLVAFLMGTAIVYGAMNGGVNPSDIPEILKLIIIIALGIFVLTRFLSI